jgi:hypothetical protein
MDTYFNRVLAIFFSFFPLLPPTRTPESESSLNLYLYLFSTCTSICTTTYASFILFSLFYYHVLPTVTSGSLLLFLSGKYSTVHKVGRAEKSETRCQCTGSIDGFPICGTSHHFSLLNSIQVSAYKGPTSSSEPCCLQLLGKDTD